MTKYNIKTVDVHYLKNMMETQGNICLIDVREKDEWEQARIPGAIHIPKDEITSNIGTFVLDKSQTIYLHCRGGVRSIYAAQSLVDAGYEEVYSVDGGIIEWTMFGYPIKK